MKIEEITLDQLDPQDFIEKKCRELSDEVGDGLAINALSGGVDSSVVTMLGHKALGDRLKTYFIDNGIMRKDEPQQIARWFADLGVNIEILDARQQFFDALKGLSDPEEKREAITQTFYRDVFGDLVKTSGAKYLLQGTIFTDVEETVAGVKRQHNILSQLGINTQEQFGYEVIEPLIQLRKPGVRKVGEALGLPYEMYNRPPFPGPALAARIIGEVTPQRVALVKEATAIVEEALSSSGAFQYLAILHEDKVTGIRNGKRDYGYQIEVRCWNSKDAKTATPTRLDYDILEDLAARMTTEIPGVVSVTYNITSKPTSTIEAV
ncbi:MAG TPA: asparagine synthase-related protein [Deltaproteobacteria bacterium]|nr:asparagine synthase-related protein [Deltaproteobacteria bacterium]HPJ92781.1 asparagine synthase-related protein [Deltaproteobacteria bacterium]HPR50776.1 asparagine synthase-related protein [Deltaproteobacteria bacterium]